MKLVGRATKLGDDVDTNDIVPTRFLMYSDPVELAKYLFCEVDPVFRERVQPGDVVVAGDNFGCGSSREHAVLALKGAGVIGIVADSFARIFFRNAITVGMPVLECPGVGDIFSEGDEIEIDIGAGTVRNLRTHQLLRGLPLAEFMVEMIEAGGLLSWTHMQRQSDCR
jgi:3-isopropylmalate/(R)-2-methylmalate dehydratase small subunit